MSTTLERLQYGYDRDSRRTWRRRALTTGEDNAYGYDGLSQVTQSALGTLNLNCTAIGAVPASEEAWDYDPTGNWRGYRVETDGSVALDQSRVHDKGNRLTQIQDDPYPVLLDRVGRVRQISPGADGDWDESQKIKWDAWGRVTEIRRASDDAMVGTYAYDGLTRRTTRTVGTTTHHCYYSDQWRPLEERKNSQTSAELQYYWGARHRDDLARRDRATTDGGTLDETRYVLMDYFSPAAITDEAGTVTERYAFSAFGVRRILTPEFAPRSTSECGFEFAFQGQFLDVESGFLNYGYRYYSPPIGRWLCKDPIAELGGFNLYCFTDNETVNGIDRLGLLNEGESYFNVTIEQGHDRSEVGIYFYSGGKDKLCPPCKQPRFVQITQNLYEDVFDKIIRSEKWHIDTESGSYPFYPPSQSGVGWVTMTDMPGVAWQNPFNWFAKVVQNFETCSVCADDGKFNIIGCVMWGQTVGGVGTSSSWGGGDRNPPCVTLC